jgi:DNA repair protein RadA/Sms
MAKGSSFVCQSCGFESPKWLGKCPSCESWASFVESTKPGLRETSPKRAKPVKHLKDIRSSQVKRVSTGISEMDRVLGGGFVPGQVVLLAGEPGVGKSTLLLQLASSISSFYILGEESLGQVATRVARMGVHAEGIAFLEETNIEVILSTLLHETKKNDYKTVVLDSVQTMYAENLSGVPGSIGQVKETAFRVLAFAKKNNIAAVLVGHVTKDGTVAGPSTLAHMVDTVLWLEGDKLSSLRVLRSVKNRFGPTDEVGIFQMKEKGMVSTSDTANLFLSPDSKSTIAGSVISCVMEGTRPILVEIQALVVPTKLAIPRRVVQGLDSKRVELIIAVLTRHCGLHLSERDVFVNVIGGIKLKDPGVDLAVAFAIASSYMNKPIKRGTVVVGEVGLLGEIRESSFEGKRVERARRQGLGSRVDSKAFKLLPKAIKILN